jgi:hypothetical protein
LSWLVGFLSRLSAHLSLCLFSLSLFFICLPSPLPSALLPYRADYRAPSSRLHLSLCISRSSPAAFSSLIDFAAAPPAFLEYSPAWPPPRQSPALPPLIHPRCLSSSEGEKICDIQHSQNKNKRKITPTKKKGYRRFLYGLLRILTRSTFLSPTTHYSQTTHPLSHTRTHCYIVQLVSCPTSRCLKFLSLQKKKKKFFGLWSPKH